MELYELYNYLIVNKGFTVNSKLDIPNDLKFVVSLENNELIVEKKELTLERFIIIIDAYRMKLKHYNGQSISNIGCWLNEGFYYFDISINIQFKSLALSIARNNNQKAIYDVENDKSIYLEYER